MVSEAAVAVLVFATVAGPAQLPPKARAALRATGVGASDDEVEQLASELALALAAGCRPVEALARCTQHRQGRAAASGAAAVNRVEMGLDPLVAFDEARASAQSQAEVGIYAALASELTSGTPAAPAVGAIARATSEEARRREAERAARAAPLVQLIVALALVPSALLIGASLVVAGLGT